MEGIVLFADVEVENPAPEPKQKALPSKKDKQASDKANINVSGSCLTDLPDLGDDAAVVLFVVVGVFVVAVLVIYGGKFIYDALVNRKEHSYSFDLTQTASFFGRDRHDGLSERGTMAGLKGVASIIDDYLQVGLAGEVGHMDMDLTHSSLDTQSTINGIYWMVGPYLGFPLNPSTSATNPSCLVLEVLAGKAEHDHIGIISAAKIGLTIGIKEHFRLGLNIGSFYFDLDESEGMVDLDTQDGISTEDDKFRITLGFEVGYRF